MLECMVPCKELEIERQRGKTEMIKAKPVTYGDCNFRSTIEARWAIVFDTLGAKWKYEIQHYDFGLKNPSLSDEYEFDSYVNEVLSENYWDDRDEIVSSCYSDRYARHMYLPDFWLPTFEHWVEIKGKPPTYEEQRKARDLTFKTNKPITILWGYIPYPKEEDWGKCTEVFGGDMNIIALFVLEYGIKAIGQAFNAARSARFEHGEKP